MGDESVITRRQIESAFGLQCCVCHGSVGIHPRIVSRRKDINERPLLSVEN